MHRHEYLERKVEAVSWGQLERLIEGVIAQQRGYLSRNDDSGGDCTCHHKADLMYITVQNQSASKKQRNYQHFAMPVPLRAKRSRSYKQGQAHLLHIIWEIRLHSSVSSKNKKNVPEVRFRS